MSLYGVLPTASLVMKLRDGARQRGLGVHFEALAIQLDLPPLLQHGRTGFVGGSLLQASGQIPGCGLDNGGLHEAAVRQPFGRRAWRADDGLEVVELLRDAVVALRADGALGAGRGEDQRSRRQG